MEVFKGAARKVVEGVRIVSGSVSRIVLRIVSGIILRIVEAGSLEHAAGG